MTPYEIMLSESQERMLLVAEKGREDEVFRVFRKWGLDAVDDRRRHRRRQAAREGITARSSPRFPTANWPTKRRSTTARTPRRSHGARSMRRAFRSADLNADLHDAARRGRHLLKRWIWEQYDYMVRTNTLAGPGGDAAIVRIKETGTSVAMSLDGNGRYCYLAPREGAKLAVAECCRNLSTVGALPVAATNSLNFGNPERPEIMAQLVEADRRHGGSLPLLRHADHRRQRQPVQRNPGRRHLSHAGDRHRRADEDRARRSPIPFKHAGRSVILLGGLGHLRRRPLRRHPVRQGNPEQSLGPAAGARYGVREARADGHPRDRRSGPGRIGARSERWRPGRGARRMLVRLSGIGAQVELDSDLRPEFLLFHEGAVAHSDFDRATRTGCRRSPRNMVSKRR